MHTRTGLLPLLIILVLLVGAPFAQAQDNDPEPHPLIQMMAMAPPSAATPPDASFLMISYADLRANEQARSGVPTPASRAEFDELEDEASLWMANMNRLISTAPDLQNWIMLGADMVNYLGLDAFEIDQTFFFGPPPWQGAIYGGHFDNDRITNTLVERTYTTSKLNGIPLLCGPIGCENGNEPGNWLPDQGDIDPQTLRRSGIYPLFGGRLARQEPLALLPGIILSTPHWDILTAMTAAANGSGDSLYDVPQFQTIADYAVDAGAERTLIQVMFFPTTVYTPDYLGALLNNTGATDTDSLDDLLESLGIDESGLPVDAGELPYYPLGAMLDWQEGEDQVHGLVLVYDNEADAQRAAEEMTLRIPLQSAYLEWQTEEPLIDMAVDEYTLDPPQTVYNPVADRWLAVATVRTPMPSNDPDPDNNDRIQGSGRLMAFWYRSMIAGYFSPVQIAPIDE